MEWIPSEDVRNETELATRSCFKNVAHPLQEHRYQIL